MTLGKEQIEDTIRKTWSKDEAKFMTIQYFLHISKTLNQVPPRTIQTGLLNNEKCCPCYKHPRVGLSVDINFQLVGEYQGSQLLDAKNVCDLWGCKESDTTEQLN